MDSEMSQRAASDMLEDALQQFDNIMSVSAGPTDATVCGGFVDDGMQGISQLLDDLRITIQAEQIGEEENQMLLCLLSPDTLAFYQKLFKSAPRSSENNGKHLQKLQNENDSLTLQVSVLSDQVELQMEKMEELIETNKDLQSKLLSTEEMLQKEIRINTDHEREITALKEQVILYSKAIKSAEEVSNATPSPARVQKPTTGKREIELISPDEGIGRDNDEVDGLEKPLLKMPGPTATSTPISANDAIDERHTVRFEDETPKKSPVEDVAIPRRSQNDQYKSVSLERLHSRRILPVESDGVQKSSSQSNDLNKTTPSDTSVPSNKKADSGSKKSCSSPNLAMTEIRGDEDHQEPHNFDVEMDRETPSPFQNRKKHGFRKFFSSFRLRKSNSQSFQGSDTSSLQSWNGKSGTNPDVKVSRKPEPFVRGGFRATAGPRLGWSKPEPAVVNTAPFAQWSKEEVLGWLRELRLDEYIENCRNWVKNGSTLLQATNQDLEKELCMHDPLHKKKLLLSLQAVGEEDELEGQIIKGSGMDGISVARWLDDIGLPQYKDAFNKARIDYRVLHHLTIGDIQRMRITNLLHTFSLRRAIYTLRRMNFDPTKLKRRPIDTAVEEEQVHLWTNHRVMEWLRSIDLAEYAPNLRGSGVHGSLMVLEPQFTGEILASLLHIPASKSLLCRHLVSKFGEIVPPAYMTMKQKEASLTSVNIMAKVKVGRRSFGPLARLRNLGGGAYREFSSGEYVCPFETKNSGGHQSLSTHRRNLGAKLQMQDSKTVHSWDIADEPDIVDSGSDDSTNIKIVELDESATRKIGAFSAELATMTNKWSED